MKFHSSMTLFAQTADDPAVFDEALRHYFDGRADETTLAHLRY
jgi:uncharacterized protein (DUF1810 family)